MRIVVNHRERVTLPGEFERLPGCDAFRYETAFLRHHPNSPAIVTGGLFANHPPAIWDSSSGKLLWAPAYAADIGWGPDGSSVYVLCSRFAPKPRHREPTETNNAFPLGSNRILHASWPERELLGEHRFQRPTCGAGHLVVSPTGRLAAVVGIQGPEWFYTLHRLVPSMSDLGVEQRIDDYLLDGPVFAPDDGHLVVVGCAGYVWWGWPSEEDDEDKEDVPSEGGIHHLAWVYVHNLPTNQVSRHEIVVDLPEGWLPTLRPSETDYWSWQVVWGPEFTGNDTFRLWLPDGSPLELRLPLPDTVVVPGLSDVPRVGISCQ